MNENKFCIIICTNNELKLNECLHYIDHLVVPEGYELEFLSITDAKSITSGYNEGMQASDAKYKIYMHQDVFLLNQNLLQDLLDIFSSDPAIGLIGLTGYQSLSADGCMWHAPDRIGNPFAGTLSETYPELSNYHYQLSSDGYKEVMVCDGYFLATNTDYAWDEEIFDGWDLYDADHSMQFHTQGKKVVVPIQGHPWALHDDGYVLYLKNYDVYRKRFMEKYQDFLGHKIL